MKIKIALLLAGFVFVCFTGKGQTTFTNESGIYAKMLSDLKTNLYEQATINCKSGWERSTHVHFMDT